MHSGYIHTPPVPIPKLKHLWRINAENAPERIIYVLVSCQGAIQSQGRSHSWYRLICPELVTVTDAVTDAD